MKLYDAIFVGAGLASAVIGLRLKRARPELNLLFLEAGNCWGGNHTWSFHQDDISPQDHLWINTLVSKEWNGYSVRFPKFTRGLGGAYYSIRSEKLHHVMMEELGASTRLDTPVMELRNDGVVLSTGEILYAKTVFDVRGALPADSMASGFQKFIGWEVRLKEPHGLRTPILMDAQVAQKEGFRFLYSLPWDTHSLLIEDTRYSADPVIYTDEMNVDLNLYCKSQGWVVETILRKEQGSLSIPLTEFELRREGIVADSSLFCLGVRAGFYNPTTGYSLPYAVRLANRLAEIRMWEPSVIGSALAEFEKSLVSFQRFSLFLNRMLFLGAPPQTRYQILERFYSLPQKLVERFYAGKTTWGDRLRILVGKPPIPFAKAWECLLDPSRNGSSRLGNRLLSTLLPSEVRL